MNLTFDSATRLPRALPKRFAAGVESSFFLQSQSIFSSSPYTGGVTPYGPQVQRFIAKITSPLLKSAQWREASGFITSLKGIVGPVRLYDYHRQRPGYDEEVRAGTDLWDDGQPWDDGEGWAAGYLPPYVVVDERAAAGALTIVVRGYPTSTKRVARMGDLFEARQNGEPALHGMLHEVTWDSRSNSDGKTALHFEPGLRKTLLPGDQIVLKNPTSVFKLANDQQGMINRIAPGNRGNFGLDLVEVLPDDIPPR